MTSLIQQRPERPSASYESALQHAVLKSYNFFKVLGTAETVPELREGHEQDESKYTLYTCRHKRRYNIDVVERTSQEA